MYSRALMLVKRPWCHHVQPYQDVASINMLSATGAKIFSGEYSVPILKMMIKKREPSRSIRIWLLPIRLAATMGS